MDRQRRLASHLAAVVGPLLAFSCGASPPCEGVEVAGACWISDSGITLSDERVGRVVQQAQALWGRFDSLDGWTIAFTHQAIEVEGVLYDGYCWPDRRTILVNPRGGRDCIEDSFIFHELGHAWGFGHEDMRMYHEWDLMDATARASGWPGCAGLPQSHAGPDQPLQ